MGLLAGIDHVATANADLDRLIDFYRDNFDLEPMTGFPLTGGDGRRIVLIPLADGITLQAVEVATLPAPELNRRPRKTLGWRTPQSLFATLRSESA